MKPPVCVQKQAYSHKACVRMPAPPSPSLPSLPMVCRGVEGKMDEACFSSRRDLECLDDHALASSFGRESGGMFSGCYISSFHAPHQHHLILHAKARQCHGLREAVAREG